MFGAVLYIILACLFGFCLLRVCRISLSLVAQIAWAVPVGLAVMTFLTFLLALPLPNQDWAIGGVSLAIGAWITYLFNRDRFRKAISNDYKTWRHFTTRADDLAILAVMVPWLIYSLLTIPFLLFYREGNLVAGWINVWGDWAVHLRSSTFFAEHTKLTLESPIWSGTQFHYPYLSAYLSAILQRLGLDIANSLVWPTFLLFVLLPAQLFLLAYRLTNHRLASVLFVYLFLLAGGGGVFHLISDLVNGRYFWQATAYSPILYTDWGRVDGLSTNQSIWFMNFIMSELFPQRAFLAGIGVALLILRIAWHSLNETRPKKRELLAGGLLFGLLPMLHTHSYIALGLAIPVIWLYRFLEKTERGELWKRFRHQLPYLFLFFGPAVLLGFSLLFGFVFDGGGDSFFRWMRWWVPRPEEPVNPVSYWLWNAGPIILLGLTALIRVPKYRPLLFAGAIIWLLGNFISWQPWNYDNLKLLTYWYLLWAIPVAVLIATLARRYLFALPIILFALTGAGLADTLSVTVSAHSGGLQMASQQDLHFARAVRQKTEEDAVILAATNHDNPLSLASGRQLYMGYEGWLWTYGINWSERYDDVKEMYSASNEGLNLIREKGIDYIAIGPQERSKFTVAEDRLLQLYQPILTQDSYILLKVR